MATLTTRRLTSALTLLSFRAKTEKTNAGRAFLPIHCFLYHSLANSLATESIERRRDSHRIQRGTARERYRGHLILVKAHQEPDTADWSTTAHIQFNQDNLTFRDVHLDRLLNFPTKTSAEKQALKEAKLWVDERLGKA